MRVLVIGSGGREHAMARALATSDGIQLYCAPGNPGSALYGRNVAVRAEDLDGIIEFAQRERIDLVVPGPEAPLCAGLSDRLAAVGTVRCCGPSAAAARLEASKAFARELLAPLAVPGPRFRIVRDRAELRPAVAAFSAPPVLKADGLCAGKGVFLPATFAECVAVGETLLDGALGAAGRTLVLEERLYGVEASLFFACHGEQHLALPHARDYKRLCDGDSGPNTGGMGALSPNPAVSAELVREVAASIVQPTLRALCQRGTPFVGFLFVGLMLTREGPRLLEFNVRLGDPEAQAILPRLGAGGFLRLCLATARGELDGLMLPISPQPTCVVVLAAAGYPASPQLGTALHIAPELHQRDRFFIYAGATLRQGKLRVSGGRIGAVVAQAPSLEEARCNAYAGLAHVRGEGLFYRRDIGAAPPAVSHLEGPT